MKNVKLRSALTLLTAAVIWGFAFSAQVEAAGKGIGCFTFNGTRFLIGGCSLIPVVSLFDRRRCTHPFLKSTLLPGMGAGVLLFIASTLQQMGINETQSAGKASFITGIYIVLVPILAFLLFRKKAGVTVWIGAVCALAGLYFLGVTPGESIALGDVYVLIGAFFWAAHILWIDHFIERVSPIRFSMIQFFTCGFLGLCAALCTEEFAFSALLDAKWEILYAGVLSSGIAYTCQVLGQRGTDPASASMILSTESVFGALGGLLVGGERLSARAWLGCALMFAGIILSQLPCKKEK